MTIYNKILKIDYFLAPLGKSMKLYKYIIYQTFNENNLLNHYLFCLIMLCGPAPEVLLLLIYHHVVSLCTIMYINDLDRENLIEVDYNQVHF